VCEQCLGEANAAFHISALLVLALSRMRLIGSSIRRRYASDAIHVVTTSGREHRS